VHVPTTCLHCGYDTSGLPAGTSKCPECGHHPASEPPRRFGRSVLIITVPYTALVITLFQFLGTDAHISPRQELAFPGILLVAAVILSALGLVLSSKGYFPKGSIVAAMAFNVLVTGIAYLLMKLLQTASV
jgi:hypothetical protein